MRVFISYSEPDEAFARHLADALGTSGLTFGLLL